MTRTAAPPGLTCLICDTFNAPDAIACKECSAPVALSRNLDASKPSIVSVVGDSNVGKTVYFGFLLDMLAQRVNQFEAVPCGAYSVNLPQTVISYTSARMFPPKTPTEQDQWYWAYYQICRRGRQDKWIDLVVPDMAGEAIAAEVETPQTFSIIQSLLGKSSAVMLLIDAALAAHGSTRPDFFAMKILSYLDSLFPRKRNTKIPLPVAVVLCKSDYCPECFDDPRRFVQGNLNRFWNLCESRLANVNFFASSVVGSLAYATSEKDDFVTPIPLHTALRGVLEPFEWVVNKL